MNVFLCRAYQFVLRAVMPLMPWRTPDLITGEGCVRRLPERLKADGVRRPLLITGPTLRRLGTIDSLTDALAEAGFPITVFDHVANDPTIMNVEDAVQCYHDNECDAIIALGGGSPMDCAKLCGARVARPTLRVAAMRGMLRVRKTLPPLYAVPTTAGTGSEATLAAVVTDEAHRKYAVTDFALIPRVAVLDPVLTYGMPRSVTAASGLDALCHAVEAYIGHSNTGATRRDAAEAVKLIFTHLERACRDGGDHEARAAMQRAAYVAGLAFTRAYVGYAHAVAHAVGGRYGVAHGVACAVALPAVLSAYGQPARRSLAALADIAGVSGEARTVDAKAAAMIDALTALNARLDIPAGFTALRAEDIPVLALQAAQEGNRTYPAPRVLSTAQLEAVFQTLLAPKAA